jgi:hypothetical protein
MSMFEFQELVPFQLRKQKPGVSRPMTAFATSNAMHMARVSVTPEPAKGAVAIDPNKLTQGARIA